MPYRDVYGTFFFYIKHLKESKTPTDTFPVCVIPKDFRPTITFCAHSHRGRGVVRRCHCPIGRSSQEHRMLPPSFPPFLSAIVHCLSTRRPSGQANGQGWTAGLKTKNKTSYRRTAIEWDTFDKHKLGIEFFIQF